MSGSEHGAEPTRGHERRNSPRLPMVRFVWYKLIDPPAAGAADPISDEGICQLCDISSTGVGILVPKPMPKGSRIFLEISFVDCTISSVGEVMNTRPARTQLLRVGVRFVALPPNDRLLLNRLLEGDETD